MNYFLSFLFKKNAKYTFRFFLPDLPAVEQVQNTTVTEGTGMKKECVVTTGTPPLTVFWESVKSGQITEGELLNITNITRYQTEYRCVANNTCGSVSTTIFIDVQCKNFLIGSCAGTFGN